MHQTDARAARVWLAVALLCLVAFHWRAYGDFLRRFFAFDDFFVMTLAHRLFLCASYTVRVAASLAAETPAPGRVVLVRPDPIAPPFDPSGSDTLVRRCPATRR